MFSFHKSEIWQQHVNQNQQNCKLVWQTLTLFAPIYQYIRIKLNEFLYVRPQIQELFHIDN